MAYDAHKNLAYSTVATAPSPASSGTSLVVATGEGARFPAVPFNATVWPIGAIPTPANSEIVRVTNISTDTLTITRAQESTSARSIIVGDQIAATATAKTFTDIETSTVLLGGASGGQTIKGDTASGGALTLSSTAHATKGKILFGASAYDEANNYLGIGLASPTSELHLAKTITNSGAVRVAHDEMITFNGAGDYPVAYWHRPQFAQPDNITEAYPMIIEPAVAMASGKTLTTFLGLMIRMNTSGSTGAITGLEGLRVAGPVYDSTLKPGTVYGINVLNQGASSVTTAVGIQIAKPTNATNNVYLGFDTADATAEGTYAGRLPILVAGNLRYISYRNA